MNCSCHGTHTRQSQRRELTKKIKTRKNEGEAVMKKFTRMLNGNWNWWSPRYKVYFGWHQITIARGDAIEDIFGDVRVLRRHRRFVPIVCQINCYWVDAVMHQIIKIYSRRCCPPSSDTRKMHEKLQTHLETGGSEQSEKYITGVYYVIKVRAAGRKQTSNNLNMCECPAAKRTQEWRNNCLISRIKFHNSAFWAALVIVLPLPFCARK